MNGSLVIVVGNYKNIRVVGENAEDIVEKLESDLGFKRVHEIKRI